MGDYVIIGAPGLEHISLYLHEFDNTQGQWKWTGPVTLKSSDFDFML